MNGVDDGSNGGGSSLFGIFIVADFSLKQISQLSNKKHVATYMGNEN